MQKQGASSKKEASYINFPTQPASAFEAQFLEWVRKTALPEDYPGLVSRSCR